MGTWVYVVIDARVKSKEYIIERWRKQLDHASDGTPNQPIVKEHNSSKIFTFVVCVKNYDMH